MPISSVYCKSCGRDRIFFSQPDGLSIKGNCGHVIENYAESKNPGVLLRLHMEKEADNAKARKKVNIRKRK